MGALEALKPGKSKEVTIIVNGREKSVPKGEVTFNELIQLAFEAPPHGRIHLLHGRVPKRAFSETVGDAHGR